MENNETKKSSARTPHEFKVMRVRECAFPAQMVDTPERAVEYWRQNIINADWYDESKEALVVLVLNTRRRIIGHNLVTLGNLDSCSVQPREIFRPVITTVAGKSGSGYSGDGGPATNALLNQPYDLVFDASGDLYIADQGNNCIREVDTNGIITTVAGKGGSNYSGDGGAATNASLGNPSGRDLRCLRESLYC